MPKNRVAIGFIHPGTVHTPFATSLATLTKGRPIANLFSQLGKRPDLSRNWIVRDFLRTPSEWLWFIDSDMTFTPGTYDALLRTARGGKRVVSALTVIRNRDGTLYPGFFPLFDPEAGFVAGLNITYPADRPFEVEGFGGGSVLFHRTVFEEVLEANPNHPMPWWQTGTVVGDRVVGYAQVFSYRVRECGIPIWVEPRAKMGHLNTEELTEEMYLRERETDGQ